MTCRSDQCVEARQHRDRTDPQQHDAFDAIRQQIGRHAECSTPLPDQWVAGDDGHLAGRDRVVVEPGDTVQPRAEVWDRHTTPRRSPTTDETPEWQRRAARDGACRGAPRALQRCARSWALLRRSTASAHTGRIFTTVSAEELDHLRSENAELRHRIEVVRAEIDELRAESLQRRDEVRQLVADLPTVVSRRTVVREMLREGANHPDKAGVVRRAFRKLARAPRKAWRMITRSQ